jgi:hypothetical protein
MRNHITAIALCGLTACAPAPGKVKPVPVAAGLYEGLSCPALRAEQARLNASVLALSNKQSGTRSADMVGVVLLGLPVGRMTGNNVADELGKAKGEQAAVNQEIAAKGC